MLTSTTIYSITCMKLVIYTTKVQCFFKRWNSPLPLNGDMPLYTKGNMYLNHFQLGNMHLKLQAQFFFFLGCISKISFKKDKEDRPCSAGCSIYKYKIIMRLVKDNCSSHCNSWDKDLNKHLNMDSAEKPFNLFHLRRRGFFFSSTTKQFAVVKIGLSFKTRQYSTISDRSMKLESFWRA